MKKQYFLLILIIFLSCNNSDESKISLYELYTKTENYDSLKIEIPQLKLKSDLIDSTELISIMKSWKYSSLDEFKSIRVQSHFKTGNRYELNLMSIFTDQETREELLGRYYVVYTKKDSIWVLTRHKMFELVPLNEINKAKINGSQNSESQNIENKKSKK